MSGRALPSVSLSVSRLNVQPYGMESRNDSPLTEESFLRNCQVDTTIHNLSRQLPQLLVQPLTDQDVQAVYSEDVTLVGPGGEELAVGREELVTLSSTLVAATVAVRQANAFVSNSNMDVAVDCQMAIDTNLERIRVEWKVDLPIRIPQQGVLVGLSDLYFNKEGKVSNHKVLKVALDGQTISAVGETLATLRRVARTLNDSPLLTGIRDSPLATTFADIRNELLQQQRNGANINATSLQNPPLYLTDSVKEAFINTNVTLTLMNESSTAPPLPGSAQWKSFAASRQAVANFVEYGLPLLSGKQGLVSKLDFYNLFASNAQLKGINGVVLASGGERIANFYRTMASLQKGGDWNIVSVTTNYNSSSVVVKWKATNPIRVEGTDRFQLCDLEPIIKEVQQVELKINGNRVLDPEWFRTLFTTIEAGRGTAGVDMLVDLLQQVENVSPLSSSSDMVKGLPKLTPEAAASFYGILCALHRDLPTLADANPQSPPAAEYLAPNIELRGYLDETLAKGSVAYTQIANVLAASLRTALLTGRVTAEAPPSPTIQFMPDGSIRVLLLIQLKVKVTPGESDFGAPLKLELVSDYKINDKGLIQEHKLIESRVNGQYTPGDVISRWIKGTTANDSGSTAASSLLDVLSWARTFSGSSSNRRQ